MNNSTGVITLQNVEVTTQSGILIDASADSRWGASGSNGGSAALTTYAQNLAGDVTADSFSTIIVTLQDGSMLTGAIDTAHTAKAVDLALDASSTWVVTADSYLSCLNDPNGILGTVIANITGNGHTVYYDAGAWPGLGGKTYSLSAGGELKPAS